MNTANMLCGIGLVALGLFGAISMGPPGSPPRLPLSGCAFHMDQDQDGFVSDATRRGDDCNDQDASIHPGADEQCNGVDDDCDNLIDEDVDQHFYRDDDGDGHGDPSVTASGCDSPSGFVTPGDDCNDADPQTYPGAAELCDGLDNSCDGRVDEGLEVHQFFVDADGDRYGFSDTATAACASPPGYAERPGDCDDANPSISPGISETCNDIDDDCDGFIDDGLLLPYWLDEDRDGWGEATDAYVFSCITVAGRVPNNYDCDDLNPDIHPKAQELCNGIDEDCNGYIDDECL